MESGPDFAHHNTARHFRAATRAHPFALHLFRTLATASDIRPKTDGPCFFRRLIAGFLLGFVACCGTGCAQKPDNPGAVISVYTSLDLVVPRGDLKHEADRKREQANLDKLCQAAGFKDQAAVLEERKRLFELYHLNHYGQNEKVHAVVEIRGDKLHPSTTDGSLMSKREYIVIDHPRSAREVRLMAGVQRVRYASPLRNARYVHYKVRHGPLLAVVEDTHGKPLPGVQYDRYKAVLRFDESYDISGEYACDTVSEAIYRPTINPDTGRFF